jgi:quinol monooxygenase YgiN
MEPMIDAKIKMRVPANKRMEVLQTIQTLLGTIRDEPGCISCTCCVDTEDEHIIIFTQEWETNENLTAHLQSDQFTVLLGVMKLLSIEPEIRINTITATSGADAIKTARMELRRELPWQEEDAITLSKDK